MSEFFKSELVRGEIQEMTSLQEFCFRCAMNLSLLDKERKMEYFEALELMVQCRCAVVQLCLLHLVSSTPRPRYRYFSGSQTGNGSEN